MSKVQLSESYWTERYQNQSTGWDIGYISSPLKTYFDQLTNKSLKILIPGCGNAYEAAYLHQNGFENVYLLDISEYPLRKFAEEYPDFPKENLLHADFFEHNESYDLIIEQTFFCALDPELREDYVEHVKRILNPNGKLVGLLFNIPLFTDHPPFGGNLDEYKKLFGNHLEIDNLEECYNSIPPRKGNEVFIKMIKTED